jgi:hypothetical protein
VSKPFKGIAGPRVKQARGGIYVVSSHERMHDTPPRFACVICKERDPETGDFWDAGEYERHVMGTPTSPACSDRHPEVVRELSPALKAPGLFDENYHGSDLEWKRWLEKHATEIREGRLNDKTSDGKRGAA